MPNDVIKLRILRGGVYPGLSREALNAITCILIREGGRGSLGMDTQRTDTHRRGGHVNMEAETGGMWSQAKECRHPQKLEKVRNRLFPRTSRGKQPCQDLILDLEPAD